MSDASNSRPLAAAREEVSWFFGSAGAALGLHAQSYDGGGGGVWDESRVNRLHRGMLEVAHRQQVARYERVLATMRSAGPEVVRVLRLVYEPFGAVRGSWQAQGVFLDEDRQLLGLVLDGPELAAAFGGGVQAAFDLDARFGARKSRPATAYVRAEEGEVGQERLLRFLSEQVSGLDHARIAPGHAVPRGHVLEGALLAAREREEKAIREYDRLRMLRVDGEVRDREQYYADLAGRI